MKLLMKKILPKTSRNPQGFTLIELMVAIAIVAILSAIGLVAFSNAQKSGRDTRRRSELVAIASAIEAAKDQAAGTYTFPTATSTLANEFPGNAKAAAGTDPKDYPYCVKSPLDATNPAAWTTSCPAGWSAASDGVSAVASWTVCTTLEGSNTTYCVSSKTR